MKKIDYRHFICLAVTLGFIACGIFLFSNAFGRIIEAGRDFGLSAAYYFCSLFDIPMKFRVTVNDLPKIPFFDFLPGKTFSPFLPETWAEFQTKWGAYWTTWASRENFLGYLSIFGGVSKAFIIALIPVMVLLIVLRRVFKNYLTKLNNNYGAESRPLRGYKQFVGKVVVPVRDWLKSFCGFVMEHRRYWQIWLCLWLFYFNAFTIFLEFLAWYLYFVFSFDVANLYLQIYKLFLDLWTVFDFVPFVVWAVGAVWLLDRLSKRCALDNLEHNERKNRGFLNERGMFLTAFGQPGVGKTLWVTDAALSFEAQILDDALEIILETDMHFPYFPWIGFENALKEAIEAHVCYDVWSVRKFVRMARAAWEAVPSPELLFGYDFERYGLTYDNRLTLIDIWQALEDYAQAYFIYTVQSSYLISNYSIRSDKLIEDYGNFPLWNTDFFRRDSRLIDSFSRHAHILDYDMLRLGKRMLEDNPNRYAFGFGVYVLDEIDKELKNTPELKGVEANSELCNQKNDLTTTCLMLARHGCVVAGRVFIHVVASLQRTGSLGAKVLELGDTVELRDKGEMLPVLPFWSPYWIAELFVTFLLGKHDPLYLQYRNARGDNTLFMYLFHGLAAKLHHYRERTIDLYGCQKVVVRVERGTLDGDFKDCVWYRQKKKVYSGRYKTDCMNAIFEARGEMNAVGLDELAEYAGIMATAAERAEQHSHMQHDIDASISA